MQTKVMDQRGSAQGHDLTVRQAAQLGCPSAKVGDRPRVSRARGRAQIGEVTDRFQRHVELPVGQPPLQARLPFDQRAPTRDCIQIGQHLRGGPTEGVHHGRVELLTPSGPRDLDRPGDPTGPMMHLHAVSQVEQPHRRRDSVTGHTVGHPCAIPPGKHLLERVTDLAKTETFGHPRRRQAVRHQTPLDRGTPGDHQVRGAAQTVQRRAPQCHVLQSEAHHRQPSLIGHVTVAAERDVVAEPTRDLGCVRHTPDPRECDHPVQGVPVVRCQTGAVSHPGGDDPGAQDVLHRLTEAQVHGQRERGYQLGQPNSRIALACIHGASVGSRRAMAS